MSNTNAAQMAALQAQRQKMLVDEVVPILFDSLEYSSNGCVEAKMSDVVLAFFKANAESDALGKYLRRALVSQGFTVDKLLWNWKGDCSGYIISYAIRCEPPKYTTEKK